VGRDGNPSSGLQENPNPIAASASSDHATRSNCFFRCNKHVCNKNLAGIWDRIAALHLQEYTSNTHPHISE
jgi:hypothetical protein